MKKIKDLAVKVGEKNWVNIGCIMEKDDGGKFMIMNRTFNPAGVPNPENRDTLIVSMFDVKPREETTGDKVKNAFNGTPAPDEEIPF